MKMRTQFVSNSSSTSYVVVIPDSFDPLSISDSDLIELLNKEGKDKRSLTRLKNTLQRFVNNKSEIISEDDLEEKGQYLFNCISDILKPYVKKEFEDHTGCGYGIISHLDS